jgi:hypothetical protein
MYLDAFLLHKYKLGGFKMIREILHKARTEDGRWICGFYCYSHFYNPCIQEKQDLITHLIIPETVCQMSHFKDKDEYIIFENDIVETENGFILQCVWSEEYHEFLFKNLKGGYDSMIGMISDLSSFTKGEVRIIGNVYDEIKEIRKAG